MGQHGKDTIVRWEKYGKMLGKHGHMTQTKPCLGWENAVFYQPRGIKMGDTDKKRNDNSEAAALQLNQWDGRLGTSDSVQISKLTHRRPKSSSFSQHQMAILWVYHRKKKQTSQTDQYVAFENGGYPQIIHFHRIFEYKLF